jgi:hypothetical protein
MNCLGKYLDLREGGEEFHNLWCPPDIVRGKEMHAKF